MDWSQNCNPVMVIRFRNRQKAHCWYLPTAQKMHAPHYCMLLLGCVCVCVCVHVCVCVCVVCV